jgi:hypothetical protein
VVLNSNKASRNHDSGCGLLATSFNDPYNTSNKGVPTKMVKWPSQSIGFAKSFLLLSLCKFPDLQSSLHSLVIVVALHRCHSLPGFGVFSLNAHHLNFASSIYSPPRQTFTLPWVHSNVFVLRLFCCVSQFTNIKKNEKFLHIGSYVRSAHLQGRSDQGVCVCGGVGV